MVCGSPTILSARLSFGAALTPANSTERPRTAAFSSAAQGTPKSATTRSRMVGLRKPPWPWIEPACANQSTWQTTCWRDEGRQGRDGGVARTPNLPLAPIKNLWPIQARATLPRAAFGVRCGVAIAAGRNQRGYPDNDLNRRTTALPGASRQRAWRVRLAGEPPAIAARVRAGRRRAASAAHG